MIHTTTEALIDYIHGALGPEEDAQVYSHIATCEDCGLEYRAEVALSETIRAGAAAEAREFPSMIKANVWQALRSEAPTFVQRLRAALLPAAALPVAAAIALVVYFNAGHAANPPSIEAAYYLDQHAANQVEIPLVDRSTGASSQLERTASAASENQITTDAPAAAAGVVNDIR